MVQRPLTHCGELLVEDVIAALMCAGPGNKHASPNANVGVFLHRSSTTVWYAAWW